MKRILFCLVITCIFILSFIPYDTILVPAWRVQLVDERGFQYKGQIVRQFCYDYTLGISPCAARDDSYKITDNDGYVEFPERRIRASLLYRIFATIKNTALVFAHGSIGKETYIDSSGPSGYRILRYESNGGPPPDTFILNASATDAMPVLN